MNKIVKNISLYTIGSALPKAIGFLLLPVYTRFLTPEDYGIVSSMAMLGTVVTIFFTLAAEISIYRLYYDYDSTEEKKEFLGTISIFLFLMSTLCVLLIFLFRNYVELIFKSIPFFPYYAYITLAIYFGIFSQVPQIYYMVIEQAEKFFFLTAGMFLLNIVLSLWFVVGLKAGAEGKLGAQLIANFLFVPLLLFLLNNKVKFKFNFAMLKNGLAYSIPMIPASLSAWVLNLSDRIFIERYFTLKDVGIYSLGYQLAEVVVLLSGGIHKAYAPHFFKVANSKDQKEAKKRLYRSNTAYITVTIFSVFLISFFSKEIVTLMMDVKFIEAYKIIPIIALSYLFGQTSGVLNLYIYQAKKTKAMMYLVMGSASLNIFLNWILVPRFGALGAAYATVASFAFLAVIKYVYSKRCYFIPWAWRHIIKYVLGLGMIFLLFRVFEQMVEANMYAVLSIKICVTGVLAIYGIKDSGIDVKRLLSRR